MNQVASLFKPLMPILSAVYGLGFDFLCVVRWMVPVAIYDMASYAFLGLIIG